MRVNKIFFCLKLLSKIEKGNSVDSLRKKGLPGAEKVFVSVLLKNLNGERIIFLKNGKVEDYIKVYKERANQILLNLRKTFDNKLTLNQSFYTAKLMFGLEKGDDFFKIKQKGFFHNSDDFTKSIIDIAKKAGLIDVEYTRGRNIIVDFNERKREDSEKIMEDMSKLNIFSKRQRFRTLPFLYLQFNF